MAKQKKDKRLAWLPSGVTAAVTLLVGAFLMPGLTTRVEHAVYDRALRLNSHAPAEDLAIIAVDDQSIAHLGSWPWAYGIHAQLLQKLNDAETQTVAFTMPLGDSSNSSSLQQLRAAIDLLKSDELAQSAHGQQLKQLLSRSVADLDQAGALANAIARHGHVLLPAATSLTPTNAPTAGTAGAGIADSSFIATPADVLNDAIRVDNLQLPPSALLLQARGVAHVGIDADADGVLRHDIAAIRVGDRLLPSMSVAVAASLLGVDAAHVTLNERDSLTVGTVQMRLADRLSWRPNFYLATDKRVPTYSYWQVLSGQVPPAQLHGKTILVGLAAHLAGVDDYVTTPFGTHVARAEAIASMVSSLSLHQPIRRPAWAMLLELLAAVGVLAVAALLLPAMRFPTACVAGGLLIVAMLLSEVGLLNLINVHVKLALPALALIAALGALGVRQVLKGLRTTRSQGTDPVENLRMLGLTFQGQGQLDLAYETFRRCPNDTQSLELMYGLGQDFERRRQFKKAVEVYAHVASVDANFKDIVQRRDRMKRADLAQVAATQHAPKRPATRAPQARSVTDDEQATQPSAPASAPATGIGSKQTLGRYEIERELGKGAMGVVYLGRDPKINRVVAIKAIALAEEFAEEDVADARARFFREAEMAGRLNHPGIVTVYDAGEDRGLAYIAMELLRGEHLSHYAEPIYLLPAARVMSLAARVADALDYAHKQNVVHRDIKPANIMFNKDTDELKITDFGIARLTDTSRTKTGIVLGTPSFMSPEQLEGRPLDGRSDLFSLGITLYQLLTGQLPFRADSMTRLMQKIATEEHVPIRSLRPELPEMAEQIVARALAKSTLDRYQTGAEMAVALRTCIRLASRKEAIAR